LKNIFNFVFGIELDGKQKDRGNFSATKPFGIVLLVYMNAAQTA
jgi:hypothetical protein